MITPTRSLRRPRAQVETRRQARRGYQLADGRHVPATPRCGASFSIELAGVGAPTTRRPHKGDDVGWQAHIIGDRAVQRINLLADPRHRTEDAFGPNHSSGRAYDDRGVGFDRVGKAVGGGQWFYNLVLPTQFLTLAQKLSVFSNSSLPCYHNVVSRLITWRESSSSACFPPPWRATRIPSYPSLRLNWRRV